MLHNPIKAFRKFRRSHRVSSYAADLFYLLADEYARGKNGVRFAVKTQSILDETGMSRPTLIKAQKELSEAGIIGIETSNSPKKGSLYTLLLVNDVDNLLVNEIYKFTDLLVNVVDNLTPLLVNDVDNSQKRKVPPDPHKEKIIYNIKLNYVDDAGAPALTHEGECFFRNRCLDPLFRERGERACYGVSDAYESLCVEILTDWAAVGQPITDTPDSCRHFLATLRKKAEALRSDRKRPATAEERKHRFQDEIAEASAGLGCTSDTLNEFYRYWTQTERDGGRMAFEAQEFWNTKTRLMKWINNTTTRQKP